MDCLRSLGQLSDSLLSLREVNLRSVPPVSLPGQLTFVRRRFVVSSQVVSLVPSKRRKAMPKKAPGEHEQTSYWTRVAAESFALLDR